MRWMNVLSSVHVVNAFDRRHTKMVVRREDMMKDVGMLLVVFSALHAVERVVVNEYSAVLLFNFWYPLLGSA